MAATRDALLFIAVGKSRAVAGLGKKYWSRTFVRNDGEWTRGTMIGTNKVVRGCGARAALWHATSRRHATAAHGAAPKRWARFPSWLPPSPWRRSPQACLPSPPLRTHKTFITGYARKIFITYWMLNQAKKNTLGPEGLVRLCFTLMLLTHLWLSTI